MTTVPSAPLLTVVTVTRNDAEGLRRTLDSIAAQRGVSWQTVQHLTIDGASTDDTSGVQEGHAPSISTFLSEPDSGTYDAMNKGLRAATGEYVQFLNSGDTFVGKDSLAHVLDALQSSRPVWMVAGAVDHHGGARTPHRVANIPHVWWRHALGIQPHCHQTCFFSRVVLQRLGGHDESLGFVADFDVVLRFGLIEAPIELDELIVHYEGGGMSEQRMHEIPAAISAVRRKRFALSGLAAAADAALVRFQTARINVGRRLGR